MLKSEKEEHQKSLSLGYVGVGWIGLSRLQAIENSGMGKAVVIAEPSVDNQQRALDVVPKVVLVSELRQIFDHPEVDGVVIATPSALHASQSVEALQAGKAVFCQKPLGRTAQEVAQVTEASREANKLLAVDFSYRYINAFKEVYRIVTSGEIGTVFSVSLVFHNAYGPDKTWFYDIKQSGGGCVMDLGVHLIDLALYGLGFPEVTNVKSSLYAKGKKVVAGEEIVEDFATVSMDTSAGANISLACSWNVSAGKDAIIEAVFYGTKGGAAFKNSDGSFYDFVAEKYTGTSTEIMTAGADDWSGRAGVVWASEVLQGKGYDAATAGELIKVAEVIDSIYGR